MAIRSDTSKIKNMPTKFQLGGAENGHRVVASQTKNLIHIKWKRLVTTMCLLALAHLETGDSIGSPEMLGRRMPPLLAFSFVTPLAKAETREDFIAEIRLF